MCLPSVLCAFLLFYGLFSHSMFLHPILCAVLSFNVPSFCSMDRSLVQCAFVLFYGSFSHSMCLPSVLWTVPLIQCAFISFYGPFYSSILHSNLPSITIDLYFITHIFSRSFTSSCHLKCCFFDYRSEGGAWPLLGGRANHSLII